MTGIQEGRPRLTKEDLWIFTDGFVASSLCGAVATFFVSATYDSQTFAAQFLGTTRALRLSWWPSGLGVRMWALMGTQGASTLDMEVRTALQAPHS